MYNTIPIAVTLPILLIDKVPVLVPIPAIKCSYNLDLALVGEDQALNLHSLSHERCLYSGCYSYDRSCVLFLAFVGEDRALTRVLSLALMRNAVVAAKAVER
jgi:hypothetical protein